jgi:hypothetical protein
MKKRGKSVNILNKRGKSPNICFHTKYLNFIFFITPLTIQMVEDNRPMANDNRPMADCEKTSRLIGFADVLPMIGSPLT